MKPFVNIADAEIFPCGHGERFAATLGLLSKPLGGRKIGASVTRVEPGTAAFPSHHHYGEDGAAVATAVGQKP
jgi:uncharacterized cupin superfamily protein